MSNVQGFPEQHQKAAVERLEKQVRDADETADLKGKGGPPDNGDMEARVAKLEALAEKTRDHLAALEKDVAVIKSNYATKADISDAKYSIIVWVVGAIFVTQVLPALPGMFRAFGWLK